MNSILDAGRKSARLAITISVPSFAIFRDSTKRIVPDQAYLQWFRLLVLLFSLLPPRTKPASESRPDRHAGDYADDLPYALCNGERQKTREEARPSGRSDRAKRSSIDLVCQWADGKGGSCKGRCSRPVAAGRDP